MRLYNFTFPIVYIFIPPKCKFTYETSNSILYKSPFTFKANQWAVFAKDEMLPGYAPLETWCFKIEVTIEINFDNRFYDLLYVDKKDCIIKRCMQNVKMDLDNINFLPDSYFRDLI